MIVAAAIAPQATPAFDLGATRDALEEIGRRFAGAEPAAIVVVTPHNVHVSGHFAVVDAATVAGSLAEWGQAERGRQPVAARRPPRRARHGFDVELLAYEAPTYFGMLCAAYAPSAA